MLSNHNALLKINRKHKIKSRLLHNLVHKFSCFLQIEDTGFSVCVVLNEMERYTEFAEPREYPNRVLFHRTDLSQDPPAKCSEHGRVLFPGNSPIPLTSNTLQRSHLCSAQSMKKPIQLSNWITRVK